MLSAQPGLRPTVLAVGGMLPHFAQAVDAGMLNAEALPASALGTLGSRQPGPLEKRTTDGVDIDSSLTAAATLARRVPPVVPRRPTTSAVAIAAGRRGCIDGVVSSPAPVRAAALAAARTAAVAAAKRVLLSAHQGEFPDSTAAVLAAGVVGAPLAAPTTLGGAFGQEDTATSPTSPTQRGSSSRSPPPPVPSFSPRVGGRREPGIRLPCVCDTMNKVNVASPRQSVGEARLPPAQRPRPRPLPPCVVVESLPAATRENVRAAVFARLISQRLERLLVSQRKAAVGSPTPLETIRESDTGVRGLSSEDVSWLSLIHI